MENGTTESLGVGIGEKEVPRKSHEMVNQINDHEVILNTWLENVCIVMHIVSLKSFQAYIIKKKKKKLNPSHVGWISYSIIINPNSKILYDICVNENWNW